MAQCCNNTVTPRMIKAGNVSVGDKIQLEDFVPASKDISPEDFVPASKDISPEDFVPASKDISTESDIPVNSPVIETQGGITGIPGGVVFNNPSGNDTSISQTSKVEPLPYSQMTQYMNNVSLRGSMSAPSIVMPQAPMTPDGYDEEINYDSIQAFNGFLRTQMGRYMRIEQLIGSNTIQDRFGFLVGVGSNFIILQEITTGNIMVLDIFSIRLTYIYYSPPVIPTI